MGRYVLLRLAQAAGTVLLVLAIVFVVARAAGDPVTLLAPMDATQAQIDQLKKELGLADPIWVQFVRFLTNAARGDFGMSFRTGQPATAEVLSRIPATLELSIASFLLSIVVSIPLGILAAVQKGTLLDTLARLFALVGQAMPNFWLGLLLILTFSVSLGWLPTGGRGDLSQLVMPAVTLGSFTMAALVRLGRSGMLEVLDSDYVRMAHAKGLPWHVVMFKHAFRNALISIVTILGLQVGRLIAGAVIVETIFAWPGLGRLIIQSINSSDYPVVQAAVTLTASSIILANLGVDLLYGYVDPRIRFGKA